MKYLLFVILFLLNNNIFAQNEADNWHFGFGAALNFSTCEPTIVTGSQMVSLEGCASISDRNGGLLFYTNGVTVWNKENTIMQNGTDLFGHDNSTQSGVIVPSPDNDSLYYIFTVDFQGGNRGLNYSVVNINRNGGLGEVISKNTILLPGARERITAVRHTNKRDIWVITRAVNSSKYYAWKITSLGVNPTPIISNTNNLITFSPIGYLKPSPDGTKIACTQGNFIELSSFDASSGVVSNTLKINGKPLSLNKPNGIIPYGIEFSPNNNLLYISTLKVRSLTCGFCQGFDSYIHQYKVNNFDSVSIANSVVAIDSSSSPAFPTIANTFSAMQIAKNGKIYVTKAYTNKLSVINKPNLYGSSCFLQVDNINLANSGVGAVGLPTFIQSYFDPNYRTYDFKFEQKCDRIANFDITSTYPYDSIRWDFGDLISGIQNTSILVQGIHTYNTLGLKKIRLYVYNRYGCDIKIDTVEKQVNIEYFKIEKFSLGADTVLCTGNRIVLKPFVKSVSYLWQNGSIDSSFIVTNPGTYSLTVTNFCGPYNDDIKIAQGICEIYIPTTFSPNADNNNDIFKVFGDHITKIKLAVYNRYGQKIFETTNKKIGWDGNYLSVKQPIGSYVWMVEYFILGGSNVNKLKGQVLLIR